MSPRILQAAFRRQGFETALRRSFQYVVFADVSDLTNTAEDHPAAIGWCHDCGRNHSLSSGNARFHALKLIGEFESLRRLDYLAADADADPRLSCDTLFPGGRGHMFGVLECEDSAGSTVVLRAFSSLHGGIRTVAGWVGPILPDGVFDPLFRPAEAEIGRLTAEMLCLDAGSNSHRELAKKRREISSELMPRIHDRYELNNFHGDRRSLRDAFIGKGGLPGGTGDCFNGLRPKGLAEFYWGGPHRSGNRQSGQFYPACEEKCQPILGFMLCGLT